METRFGWAPLVWWIDENDMQHETFHKATLAWVQSLGLDPNRLKPRAAVVAYAGGYELHVDECVANTEGRGDRVDPLSDEILSIRRIIRLEREDWPARPVEVAV